ncbi:LOW QUALITY PROTEIN: hypothetical protein HID58_028658 [Brassica napus]|uniref:Transmembrane protein n=1 Tax=Brassica napus TaxID=3708 RepID=A0ABQ8CBU9_BRANA|nr:LOW QUALITY PROTEIN: hypothetical protein HID58_028658 [Brassica napus]
MRLDTDLVKKKLSLLFFLFLLENPRKSEWRLLAGDGLRRIRRCCYRLSLPSSSPFTSLSHLLLPLFDLPIYFLLWSPSLLWCRFSVGSGAVVRYVCESGAWWFLRGLTLRHGSDPARSGFNGGQLCSGDGALVTVVSSCLVLMIGSLVLGWRALVFEISASDSSLFLTTNENLSRFWVYGELPGGGGDSLLVVSPGRLVWGSLWLEGVVVMLMRRAEFFFSSKPEVASLVLRGTRSCGLPPTLFLVTACVASISAVRVWFFGPSPVVLASFYSAWSGGCGGFIIVSSLQIRAVIGLVVGVLVVPVGDFGFLEYTDPILEDNHFLNNFR